MYRFYVKLLIYTIKNNILARILYNYEILNIESDSFMFILLQNYQIIQIKTVFIT